MNIAIVDDDKQSAENIISILEKGSDYHGVPADISYFESGEAFLKDFSRGKYEVVFMDIYMPEMTGVETAIRMRKTDADIVLIFLTTSNEFMAEAFSCHAFEYILKPVRRERIDHVMADVLKVLPIESFVEIQDATHAYRFLVNTVVAISVSGHYTTILTEDGKENSFRLSFQSVSDKFAIHENFLLINRGILVNMDRINDFGQDAVYMQDGHVFSANLRKRNELEQKWHDYVFVKMRRNQHKNRGGV